MTSSGKTGWQIVGLVLAVIAGLAGLAVVGFFILVVVGMNQWASNK